LRRVVSWSCARRCDSCNKGVRNPDAEEVMPDDDACDDDVVRWLEEEFVVLATEEERPAGDELDRRLAPDEEEGVSLSSVSSATRSDDTEEGRLVEVVEAVRLDSDRVVDPVRRASSSLRSACF
jgi:hypothetical protein